MTKVLQLKIEEGSAKIRNEGVGDDKEDYKLDIWAGIIPIERSYGKAIADDRLKSGVSLSNSVEKIENKKI